MLGEHKMMENLPQEQAEEGGSEREQGAQRVLGEEDGDMATAVSASSLSAKV